MIENYGLIIGNCISAVAAIFTARSSWSKDTWNIYINQVIQCLLLAFASVFFNSYAGIVTLLACAFRNYLAAKEKLDAKMTILCFILIVIPGILINNRGYVGFIVIVANAVYTLGMYYARRELTIKINIVVDLALWIIYECIIIDIPSIIADGIGLIVTVASIIRIKKEADKYKEREGFNHD